VLADDFQIGTSSWQNWQIFSEMLMLMSGVNSILAKISKNFANANANALV